MCNLLGQELQRIGDFEGALAQHREEANICQALEDTVGIAVAHRRLGEVYTDLGKWEKAIHHQGRHLSLAREAESVVEEQRAHATLGRTYLQMSEELGVKGQEDEKTKALTEAEKSFLRSLSTCERLQGEVDVQEHSQMRCRLYLNLGLVLDNHGNFKKACNFINQALDLCTGQGGMTEDTHRCHAALGAILLREGKIQPALQEGQKALALSAKLRDKALQCESHSFLAQVHLHNSDYEAAKKSYYKAHKMKHPVMEDRSTIERNLKVVVAMCAAEDSLVILGESDAGDKLGHYEKLGDGAANFGLFSRALSYYNKMLNLALNLNKPPSFLAPIYLSLARTYSDNKQFREARNNYMKEYDIKVQEDSGEACKTLLNIANVDEELGLGQDSLCATYQQARELAITARKPKLEAFVIQQNLLVSGLSEQQKLVLEKELHRVVEENNLDPDDVDTISDEEAEVEDEIDIDLLHFSDSDDDQENLDQPRQMRQKKLMVKRNEKGETPLHRACIEGNLRMVQKLLQQGHPVNPRDNCGWLPLHEAANHGFLDVVEALLDAGAWINDRGGQQCDGVTPIHDAAACGNLAVVRLLLQRGVSVTAKTDEGDTPLESLVKYRCRARLPPTEQEDCLLLEAQLKEMMEQAGHSIPIVQEACVAGASTAHDAVHSSSTKGRPHISRRQTTPRSACIRTQQFKENLASCSPPDKRCSFTQREAQKHRNIDRKLSQRNVIDEEPITEDDDILSYERPPLYEDELPDLWPHHHTDGREDPEELPNPLLEQVQEDQSATRSYISAINSVGSSAQRVELQKKPGRDSGGAQGRKEALVGEGEDVGDDWLIDDMGIFAKKRKRAETQTFQYKEMRKERKLVETKTPVRSLSLKKPRQVKITSMVQQYHDYDSSRPSPRNTDEVVFESVTRASPKTTEAPGATSRSPPSGAGSGASPTVVGGALRLKVRVQDRLLLVPVAGEGQGRTVEWLAEEVSRRYYQLTGLRPKLTLSTQDGASFAPDDPITLVLPTEQAELQGQVTSWDLPPLPERYSQSCQTMGRACLPNLSSALHQAEASTALDLGRMMRLTTAVLQPVLRAIQHQNNLHSLNLSNSRLGDDGFHSLVEVLPSLPSLEVLELKCSSLTTSSFCELTEAIGSGQLLKKLCSLELSYNNFSGVKIKNVTTVLTLPCLTVLSLQYCYLTLVEEQAAPFTSCLHTLSLDFNTVSSRVLSSLLSSLPQLRTLTLCALKHQRSSGEDGSTGLGRALSVLLGAGEQCQLEHLDLSSCQMTDEDLEEVSTYLYRCPVLASVNLAHNPGLSAQSLTQLLQELTASLLVPLSSLSLHGNKAVQGLGREVGEVVRHKGSTGHPLTHLSLTVGHNGTPWLQDLWRTQHQGKAAISRIQEELFLTTA